MAQDQRIEGGGIDPQEADIVDESLGREPEVSEHIADLASALRLDVHGETELANERLLWRLSAQRPTEALDLNICGAGIGHYDHFGGLAGFLQQTKGSLKPKIPFYVGGEECFCSREWIAPPVQGNFGALDRRALEEADVTVTFAEGPAIVADHAFTSGQIPLTTYEKVLSPTKMRIGLVDGVGCYPDQFTEEERRQAIIPDQFRHEIATIFNLKRRGLVVLTSCSHRGVVNIVKQAQTVSGVRKVHAVMGGFHLARRAKLMDADCSALAAGQRCNDATASNSNE